MTMLQHREMKPSGVEWLGDIPQDWDVQPLRYQVRRVRRPVVDEEIVTAFRDGQVTRRSNRRVDGFTEATDYSGYQGIKPGDLVIHAMDAFAGSIGVSDSSGMGSPVLSVCEPLPQSNAMFLAHSIRLMSNRGWIESLSRSIRERTSEFRWNDASAQFVPIPSREEQDAIVEFLDRETVQIDELIEKQQQLIETLEERRESLILSTVTRGLSPETSMQQTGQYWAPECPANWTVERLSRHFGAVKGNNAALLSREYCTTIPGEFPVYSGQTSNDGVMAEIDSWEFDRGSKGTLLTTTVGSGQVMKMRRIFGKFSLSQNCMIIDPKNDFDLDYFKYQLEANFDATRGEQSSHMQTSFRMSDLYAKKIFIPAPIEQLEIAQYLNSEIAHIDFLTNKAEEMVELLTERRQALISAAVTGKIDVRGK